MEIDELYPVQSQKDLRDFNITGSNYDSIYRLATFKNEYLGIKANYYIHISIWEMCKRAHTTEEFINWLLPHCKQIDSGEFANLIIPYVFMKFILNDKVLR